MVCHGIPSEEEILEEGDIINVDCTTIVDGYYADASRMFIIGKTTPEKEKLVQVARECMDIGAEAAHPFGFVGDIGHAVEKHAKKLLKLSPLMAAKTSIVPLGVPNLCKLPKYWFNSSIAAS